MPIEPPDPGKILAVLRSVEGELQAIAAQHPRDVLVKVALGAVGIASTAVQAIVEREPPSA